MNIIPFVAQEEEPMPQNFVDKILTVVACTEETIVVANGPFTWTLDKNRLRTLMAAEEDPEETIYRNAAIRLRLSGVDLNNEISVKQAIEINPFKLPG